MKRLLPAWLLPLVWSLVGIYGSGALWFYLSRDEYVSAWLAVAGTVVLTLVAIQLHRLTDREARFRGIREKLAAFAEEASSLVAKSTEQPLPVEEHNAWVSRVEGYLRSELDASYIARFSNFSGMTFYGDGSPRSQLKNSLDGRTRRIHEFMREFGE